MTQPQVRWEWIGEGWNMFASQWKTWVLQMLVYFSIILVPIVVIYFFFVVAIIAAQPNQNEPPVALFVIVPLVYLLIALLSAYLTGGALSTALKQLRGEQISVGDLFSGGEHFGRMLVATVLLGILTAIGMALCFVPGLVVIGLFFFTFPLIIDRKMGATEAMTASYELTRQNLLMFTLFAIVVYFLASAGGYLCWIGMLVTWPLLFTIMAVAYRDSFGVEGAKRFVESQFSTPSSYAGQQWQSPPPPPKLQAPAPVVAPSIGPPPADEQRPAQCPKCGATLTRTANFCNYCGNRLQL